MIPEQSENNPTTRKAVRLLRRLWAERQNGTTRRWFDKQVDEGPGHSNAALPLHSPFPTMRLATSRWNTYMLETAGMRSKGRERRAHWHCLTVTMWPT